MGGYAVEAAAASWDSDEQAHDVFEMVIHRQSDNHESTVKQTQ
jgi:hypothetical protein